MSQLCTELQRRYNHTITPSHFGFTSIPSLLLATGAVWLTGGGNHTNDQLAMLTPRFQLGGCIYKLLLSYNGRNKRLMLKNLEDSFGVVYDRPLLCYKYGFPSVSKLLESLEVIIREFSKLFVI